MPGDSRRVVKAALKGCDTLINNSFDLAVEEIAEFRDYIDEHKIKMIRNMATTSSLLCTEWAQTPHELICEIRYQSSKDFIGDKPWINDRPQRHPPGRHDHRSAESTRCSRNAVSLAAGVRRDIITPGRNGSTRPSTSPEQMANSFSTACWAGGHAI